MYAPQEACGVVFNVKLSFHVVGFAFWLWLLRLALRLKLAQALQHPTNDGQSKAAQKLRQVLFPILGPGIP